MNCHALNCFRYNNKTYRVDDVDWTVKPTDTFQKRDGTRISYEDYYKQVRTNQAAVGGLCSLLLNLDRKWNSFVRKGISVVKSWKNNKDVMDTG